MAIPENIRKYLFETVWSYLLDLNESMGKNTDNTQSEWYKIVGILHTALLMEWIQGESHRKVFQRLVQAKEKFLMLGNKAEAGMSETFVLMESREIRENALDDIKKLF